MSLAKINRSLDSPRVILAKKRFNAGLKRIQDIKALTAERTKGRAGQGVGQRGRPPWR